MTDKFLGVGGTDGTNARPLKMDVEGNLEVRDIDVKVELELIKDQQAEILARLDEPIDTQLTGSSVDDDNPIPTYLKSRFRVETKTPIPFSELSKGTSKILRYRDLDPSARKRYIVINTTLDVLLKSASFMPYFNEFGDSYLTIELVSLEIPKSTHTIGRGAVAISVDERLSINSDSARIELSIDEAPTSGEVIISIVEVY